MGLVNMNDLINDGILIKKEPEFVEYEIDPRYNLFVYEGSDNVEINVVSVQIYKDATIVIIDTDKNYIEIVENELMLTLKV